MHSTRKRPGGAVLTLVAGLVGTLALAGCGGGDGPVAAAVDTGWTFTDDLGNTVTLDERPARIAGLNDVLSSLWNYGLPPVASFGQTSIADDVAFAGRDLSGVAVVGTAPGMPGVRIEADAGEGSGDRSVSSMATPCVMTAGVWSGVFMVARRVGLALILIN